MDKPEPASPLPVQWRSAFDYHRLDKRAVPVSLVNQSLTQMSRRGFTSDDVLKRTAITSQDLLDPEHRVTYRQRIIQLENILSLVDDPGFWLDARRVVSISDYGLLGYAMMSSATLEQAVQIAVRYHKMAGAMFELTFLVDQDEAVLRVEHMLPADNVAQMVVEELFAGITPLISLLIGDDFRPSGISLNYPRTAAMARYMAAFECPVRFEQPFCEYRFARSLLMSPLSAADANTARICEESCRTLLDQMDIREDIVSRICHQLLSSPGEFPKLDVVAERLCIGARTLRRRLQSIGTSYQYPGRRPKEARDRISGDH
jgi:hypothetical protein